MSTMEVLGVPDRREDDATASLVVGASFVCASHVLGQYDARGRNGEDEVPSVAADGPLWTGST